MFLWLTERRIRDWIETEKHLRPKLQPDFHPATVHESREASFRLASDFRDRAFVERTELFALLEVIDLPFAEHPDRSPPELAPSCHEIALWCEENGKLELAIRYAELAAELEVEHPIYETLAGRLNREAGYPMRAIAHFHRAIHAATARRDKVTRVRAQLGLGTLWAQLGEHEEARELYQRAAWAAQRAGNKWLAGEVHHDMLVMAAEQGKYKNAAVYARRALEIYPVHHDRFPALVYDFALLLCRQRMYAAAFPLLDRIVEKFRSDYLRALARSALARAAAGVGRESSYRDAVTGVLESLVEEDTRYTAPLVNLAFAARTVRDWEATRSYASRALSLARARVGYSEELRLAKQLLKYCDGLIEEEPPQELPRWPREADVEPLLAEVHGRITDRLLRWHGSTWRRKRQAGPEDRGKI